MEYTFRLTMENLWTQTDLKIMENGISGFYESGTYLFAYGENGLFSSTNRGINWSKKFILAVSLAFAAIDSILIVGSYNGIVCSRTMATLGRKLITH